MVDKGRQPWYALPYPVKGSPVSPKGVASVIPTRAEAQVPETEPEPLGLPAPETIVAFQTEVFKELINKFAWVLGSTYRRPYSNKRSECRQLAISIAMNVVLKQGYPEYMRK